MKKFGWLLIVLFILGLLTIPAQAFITGWMSKQTELELGREMAQGYEQKYGARQDPEVTQIGVKMIPYTGRTDIQYYFKILNEKEPNAMALMGGHVYINEGLYKILKDDPSQMAFVLGHEMAHVANRHMVKNVEQMMSGGLILGLLFGRSTPTTQQIIVVAWELVQLGYSRTEEYQADHFGVSYMAQAGFDPKASITVMEKLKKLGGKGIEFLMSHPDMDKRINRIKSEYPQYFTAEAPAQTAKSTTAELITGEAPAQTAKSTTAELITVEAPAQTAKSTTAELITVEAPAQTANSTTPKSPTPAKP